ncbi:MAG: Unknown protein [uncultured Sulfurovum sp.]|uniref:DUF3015 domain-containing protein n=1 Tax=uncultured Sulfurovum sp. TaxID=269237 RepID=A0A6S6T386_9BACT|nr:MAG: Unknown protein [uncultured Sulfurovum sp.]
MNKTLFIAAATTILVTASFANPNTGCGLGNEVISNQDSVLMQVFAATTNGTSGNQTFGITSGTSGCAKPAKFVSNDRANEFVAGNMDVLALDISNGQGEALSTLATLLNISNPDTFATVLQANFDKIYTSSNVTSANVIDNIVALG